jgi:hypothetical protein
VTETPPFQPTRLGRGVLYAFAGHVIVFVVAVVAGMVVKPSAGGGFEDVATAGVTAIAGEVLLGITCLVWGALMFRRDDRERGLGLVAGWLAGLAIFVVVTRVIG